MIDHPERADEEQPGYEPIPDDECRALLAAATLGRIAVVDDGQPLIFPVNYRFLEDSIVIRTDPGTKLARAPLQRVAFEIDEADLDRGAGWSVLVLGHAREITRAIDRRSVALRNLPVTPLPPGARSHWIEIRAEQISGRRIRPPVNRP